jgi:hypothetical protein
LISDIVGDFNAEDIDYLLYYLGIEESNFIKFESIASKFIELPARLRLKKFMKNHLSSKTNLNKYEFTRLPKVRFLDLSRFRDSNFFKILEKINKNMTDEFPTKSIWTGILYLWLPDSFAVAICLH